MTETTATTSATATATEIPVVPAARIGNPALIVQGAMKGLIAFSAAAEKVGLPKTLVKLVHLRASQINSCGVCVHMHGGELREAGESDARIFSVAAWRDTPFYTAAERAALALTEDVTRIADRSDAVSDEVWNEAAKHFGEQELAALLIEIAAINAWNRLNLASRQVAGQGWG
ncbi:carboxymuconolactone decarboxylase family protein [Yinghuangia soli]|uniref:Carboxymuconolactone decarboxylase family protein n=1 Tax=Yinghuangia soli TaxID=2908204 RepID=A0AA41PWA2_9ACTN|nr:carboxymuconolactone decarboxylase family protein [Yinghuangia soli]MCF2526923.1 carboxymuconolactone decarboxylase family protein [Yinghuangia soli]